MLRSFNVVVVAVAAVVLVAVAVEMIFNVDIVKTVQYNFRSEVK